MSLSANAIELCTKRWAIAHMIMTTGREERERVPTPKPVVITRLGSPEIYPPPVVPAYGSLGFCVFVQKINKRTQNAKVEQNIQKMCSNEEVSMEFVCERGKGYEREWDIVLLLWVRQRGILGRWVAGE